mmetsp:Transcript_24243/g.29830  ORF Transcript_24243/g.29830 Transcript_24243/m.29830 type:complete len:129 (+) Transcript_24243:45-431(+)
MMKGNLINYLFSPSLNINYDFICTMYAIFSLLAMILYLLETKIFIHHLSTQQEQGQTEEMEGGSGSSIKEDEGNEDNNNVMKELADSTQGLYMIFIPFIPCLLWSLIVRSRWKKSLDGKDKKQKKKED